MNSIAVTGAHPVPRSPALSVAGLLVAVVGAIAGPLAGWAFFETSPQCPDTYVVLVGFSYVLCVAPSLAGVALSAVSLTRARRAFPATANAVHVAAVAVSTILALLVAAGGGLVAAIVLIFADNLHC